MTNATSKALLAPMTPAAASTCVLCGSSGLLPYHQDKHRCYLSCGECGLVQVPAAYWLSAAAEKAIYDAHDNDPSSPGYRRFLSRTASAVQTHIAAPAEGLDFGCGPGPALAQIMEDAGYRIALYDHFYYPDRAVLTQQYDFITATEVIEHLHDPATWLDALWSLVKPGGVLAIQTKRVLGHAQFDGWHYTRDPTHVVFFSIPVLQWLGRRWRAPIRLTAPDIALFHKPIAHSDSPPVGRGFHCLGCRS